MEKMLTRFTEGLWHSKLENIFIDIAAILLIVGTIFQNNPYILVISSVCVLAHNVLYCFHNINRNIIFALFNFTLTFFLLSRFIVTTFFQADYEYVGLFEMGFERAIATRMILLITLSLFTLSITYVMRTYRNFIKSGDRFRGLTYSLLTLATWKLRRFLPKRRRSNQDSEPEKKDFGSLTLWEKKTWLERNPDFIKTVRTISLYIFFFTVVCHLYFLFNELQYIRSVGYRQSYIIAGQMSTFMRLMDIVGRMSFSAYFIYLATLPRRRHIILPTLLFLAGSVIELFQGLRNPIALNLLIVVVYFMMRSKPVRFPKKMIVAMAIIVPILIFLFIRIGDSRGTEKLTITDSFMNSLIRFFYNQGVSARTIGNVQYYQELLPYKFYSFGELIDFAKFDVLGIFTGAVRPTGQSLSVVMETHQLSHVLSFIQSPFDYLNLGLGTGSSFIAELYADFRYLGVILGSVFYGFLMALLVRVFYGKSIIARMVMLMVTRDFLFTPRASFSNIISSFTEKTQLIAILGIFVLSFAVFYLLRTRFGKSKTAWKESWSTGSLQS